VPLRQWREVQEVLRSIARMRTLIGTSTAQKARSFSYSTAAQTPQSRAGWPGSSLRGTSSANQKSPNVFRSKPVAQPIGQPQLDERLSRHAQPGFPVQGIHHPNRKINVHSPRIGPNTPRPAQVKLIYDFFTCIELAIKCLGFHRLLYSRPSTKKRKPRWSSGGLT
jgi:hypothetical protein